MAKVENPRTSMILQTFEQGWPVFYLQVGNPVQAWAHLWFDANGELAVTSPIWNHFKQFVSIKKNP